MTIHCIDEGIDTGNVFSQREVQFGSYETLRTSYNKLALSIEVLFMEKWDEISSGNLIPVPQSLGGSYHRSKDLILFEHFLTLGWETPVAELLGKGNE